MVAPSELLLGMGPIDLGQSSRAILVVCIVLYYMSCHPITYVIRLPTLT